MAEEVSAQVTINLPLDTCWARLRDISTAHHYVPGLVNTEIITEQREGVGASRYVYRSEKSCIQETVTEWQDGRGFRIRLHKGDKPARPFRSAWFRYRLEEESPGATRFTASLGYEMPWGAFGRWLGARLAPFVQRTVADVADSMKLYYETGRPTTPQALKDYRRELARGGNS